MGTTQGTEAGIQQPAETLTEQRLRLLAWRAGVSVADLKAARARFRAMELKIWNQEGTRAAAELLLE